MIYKPGKLHASAIISSVVTRNAWPEDTICDAVGIVRAHKEVESGVWECSNGSCVDDGAPSLLQKFNVME